MTRDVFLVAKIYTSNDVKTVRSYIHPQTYCNVYVHYYVYAIPTVCCKYYLLHLVGRLFGHLFIL